MIIVLLASLAFYTTGYYVALAWMSLSIAFFLVCPVVHSVFLLIVCITIVDDC